MGILIHLTQGGEGSGNFGHSGRPGEQGGSGPRQFSGGLNKNPRQPVKLPNYNVSYINYSTERSQSTNDLKYGRKDLEKVLQEVPREHLEERTSQNEKGLLFIIDDGVGANNGSYKYENTLVSGGDTILISVKGRTKKNIAETIRHEVGHRVQYLKNLVGDSEWDNLVDSHISSSTLPMRFWYPKEKYYDTTHEAYSNGGPVGGRKEFFAESYNFYLSKPEQLRSQMPDVYDYMNRKVFK